jgi:predicted nucleic acid-binding protein
VTRYLLDTNIISEASKPRSLTAIANWVRRQADDDLFIAALSAAEIWRGVLEVAPPRRRRDLETWFASAEGPPALFSGRLPSFDARTAMEWGHLMAAGTAAGRPRSPLDMVIAATAVANGCIVVTANERHFQGADDFLNPMHAASR